LDELNLVTRLHNGDPTAFDDLYRQYSRYVAFICFKFCDNKEDAEEAMQDTFLDVYAMAATLRAGSLLGLMRRIAVCKCYRKRTQNRQLAAIQVDVDLSNQEEQNDDFLPAQYLHNKEQRNELLKIVMSLPKMQWETVYLYYYACFGTEEIARLQNCSTSNVRKTLRNARVSIKDKLEGRQKGKILKQTAAVALVSMGAVLIAEEQVFAAAYVYTTAATSTNAVAVTAATNISAVSAIKGYIAAACVIVLLATSVATYYVMWPDDPPSALTPTIPNDTAPFITVLPEQSELPEPLVTTAPPPPLETSPHATPPPTTTPQTLPQPIAILETAPPSITPPSTTPLPIPSFETTPASTPTTSPVPTPTLPPVTMPEAPMEEPIDNTQAILAALAAAVTEEDTARIILQYHFRYDQLIRDNHQIFRFYVTNEGSGDILIITATDEYGIFLQMRYAFFDGGVMPDNVFALLRLID